MLSAVQVDGDLAEPAGVAGAVHRADLPAARRPSGQHECRRSGVVIRHPRLARRVDRHRDAPLVRLWPAAHGLGHPGAIFIEAVVLDAVDAAEVLGIHADHVWPAIGIDGDAVVPAVMAVIQGRRARPGAGTSTDVYGITLVGLELAVLVVVVGPMDHAVRPDRDIRWPVEIAVGDLLGPPLAVPELGDAHPAVLALQHVDDHGSAIRPHRQRGFGADVDPLQLPILRRHLASGDGGGQCCQAQGTGCGESDRREVTGPKERAPPGDGHRPAGSVMGSGHAAWLRRGMHGVLRCSGVMAVSHATHPSR